MGSYTGVAKRISRHCLVSFFHAMNIKLSVWEFLPGDDQPYKKLFSVNSGREDEIKTSLSKNTSNSLNFLLPQGLSGKKSSGF